VDKITGRQDGGGCRRQGVQVGDRAPEEPGGPEPPLRLSLGRGDVEIGDLGDEQPLVLLLSRPPNRRAGRRLYYPLPEFGTTGRGHGA